MTIYIGKNQTFLATNDTTYEKGYDWTDKIDVDDNYQIPHNSIPHIVDGEIIWEKIKEQNVNSDETKDQGTDVNNVEE